MSEDRRRGRPMRQSGDAVGRDKLIEAARTMMRGRPRMDLPRRELAVAAGVTPALVTYHFPDEFSLVGAAAMPVIEGYLHRLGLLLASNDAVPTIFRSLVVLFLEISRDDGQLLESYINYIKQNGGAQGTGFLSSAYLELDRFLKLCVTSGYLRPSNSAFTQTLLWGTCRTVAQSQELSRAVFADAVDSPDIIQRQADMIVDILVRGLRADG